MEYIGVVTLAFLFATIGGHLGARKGRRTQGMILGFFLGPIGWLMARGLKSDAELAAMRAAFEDLGSSGISD